MFSSNTNFSENYKYIYIKTGSNYADLIEQIKPFNFNFHLSDRVQELKNENNKWLVKTLNGKEFETPNIVIAGGVGSFEPRKFPTKSAEKYDGKSVLYSIKDKTIFKDKSVVIFGGGDSALDWAIELSNSSKVTLVHRRDEFRASQIMQDRVLNHEKIEVVWNSTVEKIIGDGAVSSVVLKDTIDGSESELNLDGVFVAIGHDPNVEFLNNFVELDEKGYIKTGFTTDTSTSVPGVFAAGDVADSVYRQAVTAAGTGCQAAMDSERWLDH